MAFALSFAMASILLVEEDDRMRRALTEALRVHGFQVVAGSSVQAVRGEADRERPDIVVANIRSRDHGRNLVDTLGSDVPVIGIVGDSDSARIARAVTRTATAVLGGPVTGSRLSRVIRDTLDNA